MRSLALSLSLAALMLGAGILLSCGGGYSSSGQRQLVSIGLTPSTADAKNYPNGEVQFFATGTYSSAPTLVTPIGAQWGACASDTQPTTSVTVSASGLAQCASGSAGTFTVWAADPATASTGNYSCPAQTACGGGCTVEGTAQLTCP